MQMKLKEINGGGGAARGSKRAASFSASWQAEAEPAHGNGRHRLVNYDRWTRVDGNNRYIAPHVALECCPLLVLPDRPTPHPYLVGNAGIHVEQRRSEERRVGKECRSRWS